MYLDRLLRVIYKRASQFAYSWGRLYHNLTAVNVYKKAAKKRSSDENLDSRRTRKPLIKINKDWTIETKFSLTALY